MHRLHTLIASAVISTAAFVSAACAHPVSQPYASVPYASDVLTWTEFTADAPQDAYSAVERLRPFFLTPRPGTADVHGQRRTIRVFIDGDFAGDEDVLRSIPVRDIDSIRRMQPSMAYATIGSLHMGDVILLVRLRCRVAC